MENAHHLCVGETWKISGRKMPKVGEEDESKQHWFTGMSAFLRRPSQRFGLHLHVFPDLQPLPRSGSAPPALNAPERSRQCPVHPTSMSPQWHLPFQPRPPKGECEKIFVSGHALLGIQYLD